MRTVSMTSSLVSANTTASGGATAIQVKVWPCWMRTASAVTSRVPTRPASAAVSSLNVLAESLPSRRRTEENVASIIWIDLPRVAVRRAAHNAPASGHQAMGIVRRARRPTDDTPTTAKRSRHGRILWYFWRKEQTMASEWVGLTSQEGEQIYVNLAIASSMHRDENLTCIWFHADTGENGKIRVTQT